MPWHGRECPPEAPLEIGSSLNQYKIVSKLGEGGMGQVFRAEDTRLKREVAIKVLPAEVAGDPERIARMEREAQVLASLEHPNIAAIYGIEQAEVDGKPVRFLAMQLAEGTTLADRLTEGSVPLSEALQIALQIAEGLEAAHAKGIIHRDLKPANIQLGTDGTVKLLDFGLAKAVDGHTSSGSMNLTASPTVLEATRQGVILGTAAYMSPEQARGNRVDERTDIWAFGAVLYEMLAGRPVFGGDTATDILGGIVHKEPEWDLLPEEVPKRIRRFLDRCLRKDRKRRLQAIGDARVAILEYLEDPRETEKFDVEPVPPWQRLLPWGVAAIALLGAVGLALGRGAGGDTLAPPVKAEIRLGLGPLYGGSGTAVAISPDGHDMLAITSVEEASDMRLFLRPLNTDELTELAKVDQDGNPYTPIFSPDAQWVGFQRANGVYKVPTAGGTPQLLAAADLPRGIAWTDDGHVVFAASPTDGLSIVSENGGEVSQLTTLDESRSEVTHRWPQALPGGRVLFTAHDSRGDFDRAYLDVVDVATGERKTVQRGGFAGRYVPSGHLLYTNSGTLFAVPFDLDSLETRGSAVPMISGIRVTPEGASDWSVSANGTLVYRTGEIFIPRHPIDWYDGDELKPLWSQQQTYAEPRISPDGTQLSVMILDDGNWDLWTYDITRDVATRLTFANAFEGPGIWSPDGKEILYSSDESGAFQVYRRRSDGSGDPVQVTDEPNAAFIASDWSHDGRWVAFISDQGGGAALMYLDLQDETATPQQFLPAAPGQAEATFSPDGRWLAYQSAESGRTEVYVRPFPPAGGKWQVSDNGGGYPHWSADGHRLYYRTDDGISVVDVSAASDSFRSSRPRSATHGNFQGGAGGLSIGGFNFAHYTVAPDGRFIVFPENNRDRSDDELVIHVFTNFFDELRRRAPAAR